MTEHHSYPPEGQIACLIIRLFQCACILTLASGFIYATHLGQCHKVRGTGHRLKEMSFSQWSPWWHQLHANYKLRLERLHQLVLPPTPLLSLFK